MHEPHTEVTERALGTRELVRVFRQRWLTVALVALLVIALSSVATLMQPKEYQSESQLFVSVRQGSSSTDLVSGNAYAQDQVLSYVDVIPSALVLDPVIRRLDLDRTSAELARQITVSIPDRTVLINIQVVDADPAQAAAINSAVMEEFVDQVQVLEAAGRSDSPVRIRVLEPASTPQTPSSPQPVRNLLLGAALGLVLGVAAALLRHTLDRSVRTKRDVSLVTSTPIIGTIPFDKSAPDQPLIRAHTYSPRSEAFRVLRTNLQFVQAETTRSVVLTSTLPSEGKSTTAANLALTLGDLGDRVVLIEADLRRPKALEYMGLESAAGLSDLLVGRASLDDVLQPMGDNVWAVGSGAIPPNPSELLASNAMRELVGLLESSYDSVIIDAPPLLPVTDAAVLSRVVGGVILVVGSDVVNRDELRQSVEALHAVDARLLGVVLNRAEASADGQVGYYYQTYAPDSLTTRSERRARRATPST